MLRTKEIGEKDGKESCKEEEKVIGKL